MEIPSYFADFLTKIRPSDAQRQECMTGHQTLRSRLEGDSDLAGTLITTFLQGSYRRATAVRPETGGRLDVDAVVVTNIDPNSTTPQVAMDTFVPFVEKHYKGKWHLQGRSIGIELSYVDLDLVVTALPEERTQAAYRAAGLATWDTLENLAEYPGFAELLGAATGDQGWRDHPLWIPDRGAAEWQETHPLEQIRWTSAKNGGCNGHYVNVVKATKWWRRANHPEPKYPRGYPLEHLVGDCCPTGIASVAEGMAQTLEALRDRFSLDVALGRVPVLADRGVPSHNVLKRVTVEEFAEFHAQATDAAQAARSALEAGTVNASAALWRELLGGDFPAPPPDDAGKMSSGGFTPRGEVTVPTRTRFA